MARTPARRAGQTRRARSVAVALRVAPGRATGVERAHQLEVLWAEGEVEQRDVLRDPLTRRSARGERQALLEVPAQHDLRGADAVPARELADDGIAQEPPVPAERPPRLGHDPVGV